MKQTALYTGSFDPITNGHLDVVRRACRIFDKLIIAIGVHPSKQPLLDVEERKKLLEATCSPVAKETGTELVIVTFNDLATSAAARHSATTIVRGLRDGTDLDYEFQMAAMNEVMAPDIQTIFFPSSPGVRPITATLVRQIATMGGDVTPFVPKAVAQSLAKKYQKG
ncbi:pantetheine-phosphate adenylyltransferase [Microvirga sp. W0021]|uniref:Phosphopantetheine adenylyltransferase n=1 Tax=Hohaiivirga grylli TaxID=3133970 RepID=A0ABV0BKS4_9HYPH